MRIFRGLAAWPGLPKAMRLQSFSVRRRKRPLWRRPTGSDDAAPKQCQKAVEWQGRAFSCDFRPGQERRTVPRQGAGDGRVAPLSMRRFAPKDESHQVADAQRGGTGERLARAKAGGHALLFGVGAKAKNVLGLRRRELRLVAGDGGHLRFQLVADIHYECTWLVRRLQAAERQIVIKERGNDVQRQVSNMSSHFVSLE